LEVDEILNSITEDQKQKALDSFSYTKNSPKPEDYMLSEQDFLKKYPDKIKSYKAIKS